MQGTVSSRLPHVLIPAVAHTSNNLSEYAMSDVIRVAETGLAHYCVLLDQAVYAAVYKLALLGDYSSARTTLYMCDLLVLHFEHREVVLSAERVF